MYPEIRAFALLTDNKIYVEFVSGESGMFDMAPYMKSSFFSALHNEVYFHQAHLEFGVITWPNGQDISPATIRLEMVPCKLPSGVELKTANVHSLV
jgi:Protein of unknown function (DUF2442)